MASSKDVENARPPSQHRTSVGSTASSLPSRQSQSRQHSHSSSLGGLNPVNRVTRRKSMSSTTATNIAAMAAAVREVSGSRTDVAGSMHRRGTLSKGGYGSGFPGGGSYPSQTDNLLDHVLPIAQSVRGLRDTAIVDGVALSSVPENAKFTKGKARRASESSRVSKGEGKRINTGDLKCDKCGKGYKHSSCLTKHLWEHTPEWAYTSKLLISKHQQVQLLEAASVLVTMNQHSGEAVKLQDGDNYSSPAASGSSDPNDDPVSSADTTPPPRLYAGALNSPFRHSKNPSDASSAYSRSYQSSHGGGGFAQSAPHGYNGFTEYRQWSSGSRPSTTGASHVGSYHDGAEQADLAAAVGLLSCSYGTPNTRPTLLPSDVPPVPPLPARYLDHSSDAAAASNAVSSAKDLSLPETGEEDIAMDDGDEDMADDEDFETRSVSRGRSDEDDDGVFGHMEA